MPYIRMGNFGVWGLDAMMPLTVSMCMKIVYKRGRNICETLIILSSPSELLSGGFWAWKRSESGFKKVCGLEIWVPVQARG